ncbi:hypothetical protein GCM10027185_46100 [Spirosoma pulveris]
MTACNGIDRPVNPSQTTVTQLAQEVHQPTRSAASVEDGDIPVFTKLTQEPLPYPFM